MLRRNAVLAVLVLSLSGSVSSAQGTAVTYALDADSNFTEGCWPPCRCPLWFFEDLTGTFELEFINSTSDFYDHYAVTAVDFAISQGGVVRTVTGSGQYDLGGQVALMHRLQLDLTIDGSGPEHFDSGLVPGGGDFPRIDVDVNRNGLVCFDQLFEQRSAPETIGTSYCALNPNSSGQSASISATGSAVVTDQDFTLLAHGCPPGTPGIFYFGSLPTEVPFGEGFRCVTGATFRLNPPLVTSLGGNALREVDVFAPPALGNLLPGTSWYFQFWFRDPSGGPAGFNLSNAVRVDFL